MRIANILPPLVICKANDMSIFLVICMASDMEEEENYEIFPWALGEDWLHKLPSFPLDP